jgi:molybdate transport system substrate-binding protein
VRRLLLSVTAVLLAACGGAADGAEGRELTVSAAASLTDAFTEIGVAFEGENEGVDVAFNFGPSDGLAAQIVEGAPVDVFASASGTWMEAVEDGPGVTGRTDFARNELAVIVPSGNPAGIEDLDDLSAEGVQLILAAEGVPAGEYAREILANAQIADAVLANVVSNEEDVRSVVVKVLSGDADAGITYVTDVTPEVADEIAVIEIPDGVNVLATYPIAVVAGSEEADLARRFVDFVLADGRRILDAYGFLPPP